MFFGKIDTNKDGYISFTEYLRWVSEFLCVLKYNGLEFYFEEDDDALAIGNGFILPEQVEKPKLVEPVKVTSSGIVCPYKFSNWDLAKRARKRIFLLLEQFDKDHNRLFDEKEIIDFLVQLLKSDDMDIYYVLANVFRYDTDGDKKVTYVELADFFL